jgi:RNA polymerase sigma-54 factor
MSYELNQLQQQKFKQIQRLIMSPKMQQALNLMQLPVLELTTMIDAELEQNPVLEIIEIKPEEEIAEAIQNEDLPVERELNFDDNNFDILKQLDDDSRDNYLESAGFATRRSAEEEKKKVFQESSIQATLSLFQHLMLQAKDTFEHPLELKMAEELIGNFDESGFLKVPMEEIALLHNFEIEKLKEILAKIQTFDPIGVGAISLQESLLIQLRNRSLEDSLASKIVGKHYDDLLHNRIPNIKKALKCSLEDIRKAIDEDISKLDLHPGTCCSQIPIQAITPDVTIKWENDDWVVFANNDFMPSLRLNRRYLRMLEDETLPKETKDFIKNKIVSAKWLMNSIEQRRTTIERIAYSLAKRQSDFFLNPIGNLVPLIMKVIAEELELNESTIARAVSNKYINTPRGVFPLRYFFSNAYTTNKGEDISSNTVRELLKEVIDGEDKKKPFSDEALSKIMKEKGINCARRTVAKYRSELNIGSTTQRRLY